MKKRIKKLEKERNKMSVFNSTNKADHTKALAFLDPWVELQFNVMIC